MDAERFGRALGVGVREGAKALLRAADAAAAPNPRPTRSPTGPGRVSAGGLGRSSRRFAGSVWTSTARAGGVLWHEVTGVFFALFALAAAVEVWRRRADLSGNAGGRVWFAVAMLLFFSLFSVQSFLRARRRARR